MFHIDQIEIGQKAEFVHRVTEASHQQFADFSGDKSPIHQDEEFCRASGYPQKIGYAFYLTSKLSYLYGEVMPGGTELCLKQSCQFKAPFFVGDELKFELEVTHKNESMKLITIKSVVKNQDQKEIFQGEALMQLVLGNPQ